MIRPRVLVVGDSMLDRYWSGSADRLSPEAPVPVLSLQARSSRAGGAANVALNLTALECEVTLLTLMGDDDAGRELLTLLRGVSTRPVRCQATTEKIRAVTNRHQLLRIDIESEPQQASVDRLTRQAVASIAQGAEFVVLSDYAKGALGGCVEIIEAANDDGARVIVDPKGLDFTKYHGAWLLKPNEAEFSEVVGPWRDEAELRATHRLGHLLVTRGERGMALFSGDAYPFTLEAERREVFDVCGAGDTVLATLAAMLARGSDIRAAVIAANRAAGIVVGRFGTSAVTLAEIA
jgi:D-glycero-beta-D-manno-heptose-7-phosphate kinase